MLSSYVRMVMRITTMPKEPQLPEFNNSELIRVNTEHHSIEIEKSEMAKVIAFCDENKISHDYYMFEFMVWENES